MSGVLFLKRLTVYGVSFVFGTGIIVQNYTHYQLVHGKKKLYKLSQWSDSISIETKELLIAKRQPIVETLRRLFSFEELDCQSVSHFFVDKLVFEDPIFRCNSKQELLEIYQCCMLEGKNKQVKISNFEVFHSQDCIHILLERNGNLMMLSSNETVPSTVVVTLAKEAENEKVVSISDEWNSMPLLNQINNPIIGKSCILFRRFQLKFALLQNSIRTWVVKMVDL